MQFGNEIDLRDKAILWNANELIQYFSGIDLTGEQRRALHDTLAKIFPDVDTLIRFVSFDFNKNLATIAGGDNLSTIIFNLISWAEAEGQLADLIVKASIHSPHKLKNFIYDLLNSQAEYQLGTLLNGKPSILDIRTFLEANPILLAHSLHMHDGCKVITDKAIGPAHPDFWVREATKFTSHPRVFMVFLGPLEELIFPGEPTPIIKEYSDQCSRFTEWIREDIGNYQILRKILGPRGVYHSFQGVVLAGRRATQSADEKEYRRQHQLANAFLEIRTYDALLSRNPISE